MILCTGSLKISSRGAHVKDCVQRDAVVKRTRTGWIAALSSLVKVIIMITRIHFTVHTVGINSFSNSFSSLVKAVSATHSCFKSPAVRLRIVKSALTQTILMIQWPILTPTLTWAVTLKHPAAPSMILFRMMILMLSQRENSDYPSMTIYFQNNMLLKVIYLHCPGPGQVVRSSMTASVPGVCPRFSFTLTQTGGRWRSSLWLWAKATMTWAF